MIGQGLIVVGVNRSGTSAIAAAFQALGVYFGLPEDLPASGADIDYDAFENRRIVDIGGFVLRTLEKESLPARGMFENWRSYEELVARVPAAGAFISNYFGGHTLWGWKDPRTSLVVPFFESAFEHIGVQPIYFMPVRHPVEVAQGLFARQGLPLREGIGYWLHYTLTAITSIDPDRLILVPFQEFVESPRQVLEPIWRDRGFGNASESDWGRVRGAVRPALLRTRAGDTELPAFARKVWTVVGSLAAGRPAQPDPSALALVKELTEEWREWSEMTRLSAIAVGEVRWMATNESGSMSFRGENEWHYCSIKLPLRASGFVDLWFLPRFRMVYVRNVQFSPDSGIGQIKALVRDSAFAEFAENGDLKLFIFGPTAHLSIEIPKSNGVGELRFEFSVAAGKQAASQVAQRLAAAYEGLRTDVKGRAN